MGEKIVVATSGIYYPLTMMRYMVEALQRRKDVEVLLVGPYTGNWIPWQGGIDLPAKYAHTPHIPLPASTIPTGGMPFEVVAHKIEQKVDLWLEIDAGWHFKTRPNAGVVAHILTDPHCLREHYQRKPQSTKELTFCMQTPYMYPGEYYLPYAYDPTHFYPEDLQKDYHGALVGLHYPQRDALVNRLRHNSWNIHYSISQIFDEFRNIYNRSEIALSWSSMLDLPTRVFEYAGMARPMVVNRVPDMATFFVDGEHYLGFDTVDEAVYQFGRLMEDDDMRFEMGEAAWRKVKDAHTWDIRMGELLRACKVI